MAGGAVRPVELAGYLDDWAFVRRAAGRPEADWRRLVAAARAADPDPWRDALRAKFGSNDADAVAEFRRLADDAKASRTSPRRAWSCWPASSSSAAATASGPRGCCGGPCSATRATSGSISSWPTLRGVDSGDLQRAVSPIPRRRCGT